MADIIVDARTRVAFVPTISNPAAPTVSELNAGELLHDYLIPTGLAGFESTQAEIDTTSLGSGFDTKAPGRKSYSGTALTFKEQDPIVDAITAVATEGTDGYIVIRDRLLATAAWAATQKVEVYPIRTGESVLMGRGEANSLLRRMVPTPIILPPTKTAVVAA